MRFISGVAEDFNVSHIPYAFTWYAFHLTGAWRTLIRHKKSTLLKYLPDVGELAGSQNIDFAPEPFFTVRHKSVIVLMLTASVVVVDFHSISVFLDCELGGYG
jgi:hypothetical protein